MSTSHCTLDLDQFLYSFPETAHIVALGATWNWGIFADSLRKPCRTIDKRTLGSASDQKSISRKNKEQNYADEYP